MSNKYEEQSKQQQNEYDIPDNHIRSYQAVNLVATYEELMTVKKHLTCYFGDYGEHYRKADVTDEQFRAAYEEALRTINMSSQEFVDKNFVYRGDIQTCMRECKLAETLKSGDEIVYVPSSPTGANGLWQYEAGQVTEVDVENKTCVVSSENGENTVPFRYILAQFRGQDFEGNAFGFGHAEQVLGMHVNRAHDFLCESKMNYDEQHKDTLDFTKRMLGIPGIDNEMIPKWIEHAFEMAVIDEEDGVPQTEARRKSLSEFADAFEWIENLQSENKTAAKIFNYKAGYVGHEIYAAAAFIANGVEPAEAYEMANNGALEGSVAPDEDEEFGGISMK